MTRKEARLNAEVQHLIDAAGTNEAVSQVLGSPKRLRELRHLFGIPFSRSNKARCNRKREATHRRSVKR